MRKSIEVEYKGTKYPSIKSLSDKIGVPYYLLVSRIRVYKMSVEEAVDGARMSKDEGGYLYNGVHYKSLSALAKEKGISYSMLYNRVVKCGMDLETAVEKVGAHCYPVTVEGEFYETRSAACDVYGITYSSVCQRMERHGVSFETALLMSRPLYNVLGTNEDVKEYEYLCSGRYAMIVCAVCGANIVLSSDEARTFKHSDKCKELLWEC